MGGLIYLTDLAELCCINQGDDLQDGSTNMDKAATMLGMLIHTSELLLKHTPLDSQTLENFKQNGIRELQNHYSLKSRSKINEI